MTIEEQREAVVKEAREWESTPYHHGACIKSVGVSCSWFIASVFNNALGLRLAVVDHFEQWYLSDKNVQAKNDLYLDELRKYGFVDIKLDKVKKGDLVVSKTSNILYCHGGIILDWPSIIHVAGPRGVELIKSAYASWFFGQDPDSLKFFTRSEWA